MSRRTRTCVSYLSFSDAAKLAKVTPKTVRTWVSDGLLEEIVISERGHVIKGEVLEVMRARAAQQTEKAHRLQSIAKEAAE